MNPKHIVIIIAIVLAVVSMIWPAQGHNILAAAVILLAAVNFIP
jgi:hypothetical protein